MLVGTLKQKALELGFERIGVAPAKPSDGFDRLGDWLARGFAGDMDYMHRQAEARRDPASILPHVRSVVMTALNYKPAMEPNGRRGQVARYALGGDYHDVVREKLNQLLAFVRIQHPEVQGRGVVDTAPLLERDFARRAGLGWFGKNTMLIHPRLGSYFFLGALLLDLDLPADEPFATNHCGTCTRCLDACPTDAFPAPGWLDARRCISYLTIEHRGPIGESLREGLGDWIFGCDVCQEVCPWNKKAPLTREPMFAAQADLMAPNLIEWLTLSDEAFRRRFRGTALFRTKRSGLVRNVALVLGNLGELAALEPLRALLSDPEPAIRDAAAWAIGRIQAHQASNA